MDQGSLGELYLTRSVTKHIRKHNKSVVVGSGVGKDYSMVKSGAQYMVQSEAIAETPLIAWTKAINNLCVSGGNIAGARVCYMLPVDTEEHMLKEYAAAFNALADKWSLQIVGGDTRVSTAYIRPSFLVEMLGYVEEENSIPMKAKADYDIVMAGYTGVLGTNLIVEDKAAELKKRFAGSYVEACSFPDKSYCIKPMIDVVKNYKDQAEVSYMHDISFGGVYGALWQLGEALKLGVLIDHRSIPIKQETVELCNYFDINPYMLESTGALLVVARDGKLLAEGLCQAGYKASVIGRLTQNKDRVVVLNSEGEKRFLAPVKGDEIYKVISAY